VGEHEWTEFSTSVDAIERATGYDFLNAIPEPVQRVIEARIAPPERFFERKGEWCLVCCSRSIRPCPPRPEVRAAMRRLQTFAFFAFLPVFAALWGCKKPHRQRN